MRDALGRLSDHTHLNPHGVGPDSFKAIKEDFQTDDMKRELQLADTTNEAVPLRWRGPNCNHFNKFNKG